MNALTAFILSKKYTDKTVQQKGGGDMLTSVYDSDNDGIVNKADVATEAESVDWDNIDNKPDLYVADVIDDLIGDLQPKDRTAVAGDIAIFDEQGDTESSHVSIEDIIDTMDEFSTDISNLDNNKVDKIDGKSLVLNSDITQISTNKNNIQSLFEKITEIELFKFPNAIIHGEPTINNGQISGFSNTNYLVFPSIFDLSGRGFEFKFTFTTKDDIITPQNILGGKYCMALFIQNGKLNLRVSSNGTSWNLVTLEGSVNIETNKTYYIKINFTRLNYVLNLSADDITYSEIGSISTGDISPYPAEIYIGVGNNFNNPFKGIINLNKCYLKVNQSIIWQGMDDAGLSTRLATDLDNIDSVGINKIKEIVLPELENKVDKVTGKGLSTNDYDSTAKTKVDNIPPNPKYTDTVYDDNEIREEITMLSNNFKAYNIDTKIYTNTTYCFAVNNNGEIGILDNNGGFKAFAFSATN